MQHNPMGNSHPSHVVYVPVWPSCPKQQVRLVGSASGARMKSFVIKFQSPNQLPEEHRENSLRSQGSKIGSAANATGIRRIPATTAVGPEIGCGIERGEPAKLEEYWRCQQDSHRCATRHQAKPSPYVRKLSLTSARFGAVNVPIRKA